MNSNRISNGHLVDRTQLLLDIDKLLSLPSNYEIREGRTFIKSLNRFFIDSKPVAVQLVEDSGNILNSYDSYSDCAKTLGVSITTVSNRVKKGNLFKFNGTLNREIE